MGVLFGGVAILTVAFLVLATIEKWKNVRSGHKLFHVQPVLTEYATLSQLDDLSKRVDDLKENFQLKLERQLNALDDKSEARAAETHKRLNKLSDAVTKLNTQTEFVIKKVFKNGFSHGTE